MIESEVKELKIEELHIYGYGKFENKHFKLGQSNLSVIYGENEAGKSTIMSFIHSILFGFPTKQQSENRYEPKRGTSYGGYLMIKTENGDRIKIERIPGKFGGQVVIELEEGSTENEDFLQSLLGGVDKETYRSIFSFDVHGLQQIQKMDADQIGKYLFLSSIYGADALFSIEDSLTKQLDHLYKPNGKRPLLNEGLTKLKESAGQLQEAKGKINHYEYLIKKRDSVQKQLISTASTKRENIFMQRQLEKLKSVLPLVKERNWCIDQLKKIPATDHLPEDGLQKLDHFHATLQPLEIQLHSLQNRKSLVEEEVARIVVNEALIQKRSTIQKIREQLSLYEEKQKNVVYVTKRLEQLQHEIDVLKQRLYPYLTDNEIMDIKATIVMKESIKGLLAEEVKLKQKKQWLDEHYEQVQGAIEEAEWKIDKYQKEVLSDKERTSVEQEVSTRKETSINQIQQEHQRISAELKERKKQHKGEKNQRTILLSVFALLFLVGSIWLFFQQSWLMFGILVVACLGVFLQLHQLHTKKDTLVQHLESLLKNLDQKLLYTSDNQSSTGRSLSELMNLLDKDHMIKQSLHQEQHMLEQQERAYERILKQYEEWEKEQFQHKLQLSKLADKLQIDENSSSEVLLEAFETLQHLQNVMIEKNKYLAEEKLIVQDLLKFEEEVHNLANVSNIEKNSTVKEAVYELAKQCSSEIDRDDKRTKLLKQKIEIEEELEKVTEKVYYLKKQRDKLIEDSHCQDEDEYRKLAKFHEQRQELQKQKLWIEKQLSSEKDMDLETISNEKIDNIEMELKEAADRIEQMEANEQQLQQEYSSTLVKIDELEQSGTYSKLRHAFENEKAVIRDEAEKWVIKALAKDLLQKTVQRHREEKLPALLSSITYYFKKLTSNAYKQVFLPSQKQSFLVERQDGMKFLAEELSQATSEQLYLAIRLAIIKNINAQLNLPIIIDDSFVHFDHRRTSNTLLLLHELKQDNQVIFFTCHQHIATSSQSEHMVNL